MNRQLTLLAALGAVLLVVVAYLFLIKPQQDEVTEIRTEIESTQDQQTQVRAQISRLEDVRARIPEVEAAIAAAETILPRDDAKLAAAVRQLQVAANDSGAELTSISMGRPEAVTADADTEVTVPADLASISVTATVGGGYFQIVDFLRRVEDPALTPRAVLWGSASVTLDEYPTLTANLSGNMFAYLEDIGVDEDGAAPQPETDETETDEDVDVDVDVDVTETATETDAGTEEAL